MPGRYIFTVELYFGQRANINSVDSCDYDSAGLREIDVSVYPDCRYNQHKVTLFGNC